MAESKVNLKSLLMNVKEESEEAGIKLNIQKTKIMASSPITSWQIEGGKWKQWQILFSWVQNHLTEDSEYSHEIKVLVPWKESCDKPRQRIQKQRHHFADKGPYTQSCGFSSSHV